MTKTDFKKMQRGGLSFQQQFWKGSVEISAEERTNLSPEFTVTKKTNKQQSPQEVQKCSLTTKSQNYKVFHSFSLFKSEHMVQNNENNPTEYVQFYLFDHLKGFIKAFNPAGRTG